MLLIAGTTSHWIDSINSITGVWSSAGSETIGLGIFVVGFGMLYFLLPNTGVLNFQRLGVVVCSRGTIWFIIHHSLLRPFKSGWLAVMLSILGLTAVPVLMLWVYGVGRGLLSLVRPLPRGHQMSEQHRRLIIGEESVSIRYQELLAVRLMVALELSIQRYNTCLSIAPRFYRKRLLEERVVVDLVIEHLEYAKLVVQLSQ